MRIVAISDTHGMRPWAGIPDGDVLVHAGDLTRHGSLDEVSRFNDFLGRLPHPAKLVIAGNHDRCFETQPQECRARLGNATYLQDEAITIAGLQFYGSPWQPAFKNLAFNLPRGAALAEKWANIPAGTNVLITHSPPFGLLDRTIGGKHVGCADLLDALEKLHIAVHIFGHVHEAAGRTTAGGTQFINASTYNTLHLPLHRPLVIDVDAGQKVIMGKA